MCAGSMGWMAWCDRYGANLFENSTTDMGTIFAFLTGRSPEVN